MTIGAILSIRGLTIEARSPAGWTRIVNDVDLDVKPGEILGLIGESGAGKSTIGLAAMGFCRRGVRISRGSIVFAGEELTGLPDETLRRMRGQRLAYVAQSAAAAFNPAHRLLSQCAEGLIVRGMKSRSQAHEHVLELYRELNLPSPAEMGRRFPHQVSGGQLQRAMTAMAMACRPDLIVFDEPTTALDVTTQLQVLVAIKSIVQTHHTAALYISHDLAVVAQMADRLLVLRGGRMVEQGETTRVLSDPVQPYTRQLVAAFKAGTSKSAPLQATDEVLGVRNLDVYYARNHVLHNVSLAVRHGQTVAVVGESGSGKSSLARTIAGLKTFGDGEIRFLNAVLPANISDRSREQLRNIQLVGQSPDTALNPKHRVDKILGRPLSFFFGLGARERDRRVSELLDMVELPRSLLSRFPSEMSGGQKQRLCIARALAAEPALMICDEVTSALDPLIAQEVVSLLKRLQTSLGTSYLFITHDINVARALSDEMLVMQSGVIVERGPCEDLVRHPRDAYTKKLLSAVPEMDPGWLTRIVKSHG